MELAQFLFAFLVGKYKGQPWALPYPIYVLLLIKISKLTNFDDDNFLLRWKKWTGTLVVEMENELEAIM
jgi:hypothetical protein